MKIDPLTGHEARLLLNYLDNTRAAVELSRDDYGRFWQAKFKLIGYEVRDQIAAAELEHES